MNDIPLVSIIINNYNYGRFLREAIDSALNQTYPYIEVVVVDDGSTDNSREIIASYKDRIITVLKENGGQASAFNAGFAASKGEIICILDSDDIFLPEKVAEIVDIFGHHRGSGWCFHHLRLVDTNIKTLLEGRREGSSQEWDFRLHLKRGGRLPSIPTATSGICFTRSLLQMILPMPEAITITSDNYLKFVALALSKGVFMAQELALQRVHGNNAYTLRNDKQKLKARILILTAHWMRVKFPAIARFTNKIFARGVSIYWRTGGIEAEYLEVINNYVYNASLLERFEIGLRAVYHRLKL